MLVLSCAMLVPAAHAQDLPPVEYGEKKYQNMDSRLVALYESAARGQPTPSTTVPLSADVQTVQVVLEMVMPGAPVPEGLGIAVETSYEELVQATVPVRNLAAIAADENVRLVTLPARPVPAAVEPAALQPAADARDQGSWLYLLALPAAALPAGVIALAWKRRASTK